MPATTPQVETAQETSLVRVVVGLNSAGARGLIPGMCPSETSAIACRMHATVLSGLELFSH